ncbi:MAG: hypothetical protein MI866_15675, partial [Bacteroidales bacterium]|nr:hypothetical protein [Bacteroidales bacterium]
QWRIWFIERCDSNKVKPHVRTRAVAGAIIGGLTAGSQFLYKKHKIIEYLNMQDDGVLMEGKKVAFSNDNLETFVDYYFGEQQGLTDIEAVENIDRGVAGRTYPSNPRAASVGQSSRVKIAKTAFRSKFKLYNVVGHEFVHVAQYYSGLARYINFLEAGAYSWNKHVYDIAGKELPTSWSIQLTTRRGLMNVDQVRWVRQGYRWIDSAPYQWNNLSTFNFNNF